MQSAIQLNRKCIGIELSEEYVGIIKKRLSPKISIENTDEKTDRKIELREIEFGKINYEMLQNYFKKTQAAF